MCFKADSSEELVAVSCNAIAALCNISIRILVYLKFYRVFPNDAESAWRRLAITAAHRELQLLDLLVSVQQTFFSSRMKSGGVAATQASLDWLTYLAARSFLDPASDGSGSPQRASGATATAKNEPFKKKLPNVTQSQLTSAQTSVTSGGLSIISAIHAVTLMQCTNALQVICNF